MRPIASRCIEQRDGCHRTVKIFRYAGMSKEEIPPTAAHAFLPLRTRGVFVRLTAIFRGARPPAAPTREHRVHAWTLTAELKRL